jgi:hypothetical protein
MMSCFEILPMVWVDWEEKLAVWILADIVVELGFVYCKQSVRMKSVRVAA